MLIQRNISIDIIRGFAMLLVVLGHTISGITMNFEDSFIFQIIWTLQMPLFILISGYVTRYSKPITSVSLLIKYLKKRSISYLLPWGIWTFVIRGLILDQTNFFNLKYLFWNMDTGYWFLVTIWTISVIYGCSDYLSNKFKAENVKIKIFLHLLCFVTGMIILMLVGLLTGYDFFCLKLTLYYMPFYFLGYMFGQLQDIIHSNKFTIKIQNIIVIASLTIWTYFILRYNFYDSKTTITEILMRFTVSLCGCIAIMGLMTKISTSGISKLFQWGGIYSLEIYLAHYLFLNIIPLTTQPQLISLPGLVVVTINYALAIVLTYILISLIKNNSILNYIVFAKKIE